MPGMGKRWRSQAEGGAHTLCSKDGHSNTRAVGAASRHTALRAGWGCPVLQSALHQGQAMKGDQATILCATTHQPPPHSLPPIPRDAGVLLV